MSKRDQYLYIEDIKTSLRKIEEYTKNIGLSEFMQDEKPIDAVLRNLTVIGEAAKNISQEIKFAHPHIPWEEIVGMRNKVIHEYFGVDEMILWKTIQEDLPTLEKQISEIAKTR